MGRVFGLAVPIEKGPALSALGEECFALAVMDRINADTMVARKMSKAAPKRTPLAGLASPKAL